MIYPTTLTNKVPIVAYMAVHNGEEFIRESIISVISWVDNLVVLEGAWGENIAVNGQPRSTDKTLKYLEELQEYYEGEIEVHQYNEKNQLNQRNKIFDHIPNNCWLWILDHDEVYEPQEVEKLINVLETTQDEGIKIKSLTFINDAETFSYIGFPRLFRIKPGHTYTFSAPNDLLKDGRQIPVIKHEYIRFFHYSYCHKPERFLEKRRERVNLHGSFAWDLDKDGKVTRSDAKIQKFSGTHPPIMRDHKLITGETNGQ